MKLWLITQTEQNGYDTYDSAVVAAENEIFAQQTHPTWGWQSAAWASDWKRVTAKEIGDAKEGTKAGIILASYNAG